MAKTKYESKRISADRMRLIDMANAVAEEYAAAGLALTLRQMHYQFVSRNWYRNNQKNYNLLGDVCRDARMGGLMDWDHLTDLTRELRSWVTHKDPQSALQGLAKDYHRDVWAPQRKRVEVWVEKDAAIGVVAGVCKANHVPFFSCRGYTSMSEMHEAAQRIRWHIEAGSQVTILHIGDHDPSGLDMTRDIEDRLRNFIAVDWAGLHMGPGRWTRGDIRWSMVEHMEEKGNERVGVRLNNAAPWKVKRIALNMDQIEQYAPPPNFAKTTDARFRRYQQETGLDESWELDALDPQVLQQLIQDEVDLLRDETVAAEEDFKMETERTVLHGVANWWEDVATFVTEKGAQS